MHTKVMTWLSIAVLATTIAFWNSAPKFRLELSLVVTVAAAVIFIQAAREKKYSWVVGFFTIALLFNPVAPVFRLAGGVGLSLVVLSVIFFEISLAALKQRPLLSIPSITDRNPGSQSL